MTEENLPKDLSKVPPHRPEDTMIVVSYWKNDEEVSEEKYMNLSHPKGRTLYIKDTIWAMKMGWEIEVEEMSGT